MTSLLQRIVSEAQQERPCPTCGEDREYRHVWRNVSHFLREGRLQMVCSACGPFDDPEDP